MLKRFLFLIIYFCTATLGVCANPGKWTRPFDLIEQETDLIDLLLKVDPELVDCKDPLEIAERVFPIVCDLTVTTSRPGPNASALHNKLTLDEYYDQVIRSYGEIQCGGKATFLSKILNQYFDVDAFIFNFGSLNPIASHVLTIVPIKNNSRYRFYLFDTHYHSYFIDLKGNILDLESIFSKVPFKLKEMEFTPKIISIPEKLPEKLAPYVKPYKELNGNEWVYISNQTLSEQAESYGFHLENCSWNQTYPLYYLYIGEAINIGCRGKILKEFLGLLDRFQISHKLVK